MKNKIKILHVCWEGSMGGLSRFVYEVVANQKCDPDLDVSICYSKAIGPYYNKVNELGVPVFDLDIESGYQILSGAKKLYSIISKGNYHVVQLHCPSPPLMLGNYIARKKLREKPIFIFTDHGFLLSSEAPFSILELKKKLNRKNLVWYFNHIFDHIIVNSHYVEKRFLKYGVWPDKLKVIYHGIDLDNIKITSNRSEIRKNWGFESSAFIVGTASRLVYYKKVDRLIEAARRLKNIRGIYFVIIGDGNMAQSLKRLTSNYQLEDKVIFLGEQMAPYDLMNAMDLFVLTSSGDAFASVTLEAQAAGVPVILFKDSGGITEIITDQINGFMVNDDSDLADRILSLSKDRPTLEKVGLEAKKSVIEMSVANFVNKSKGLYIA